ncbi:hypothetical protein H6503_03160 [Candidatus Woesearchaeota archaeon]|nr:hypothetical protein [Candidatus Woesearchaeota archaeon]
MGRDSEIIVGFDAIVAKESKDRQDLATRISGLEKELKKYDKRLDDFTLIAELIAGIRIGKVDLYKKGDMPGDHYKEYGYADRISTKLSHWYITLAKKPKLFGIFEDEKGPILARRYVHDTSGMDHGSIMQEAHAYLVLPKSARIVQVAHHILNDSYHKIHYPGRFTFNEDVEIVKK